MFRLQFLDISLYHMWILNPAHAYNMICVASEKMQNILERYATLRLTLNCRRLRSPEEPGLAAAIERELEKRAYWVIYIIDKSLHCC